MSAGSSGTSASPRDDRGARVVVGIGDLKLGSESDGKLVTFALGSCVGVTIYDSRRRVGGMLHAMLPSAALASPKARAKIGMFVDSGLPELFKRSYDLGADRERLEVCVAGGASIQSRPGMPDLMKIGERNDEVVRQLLEHNRISVRTWDTGGTLARNLTLDLTNGTVTVATKVETRSL